MQTKEKPTSIGRPLSLQEEQLVKLRLLYLTQPFSIRKLAKTIGTSRSAIERAIKADFYGL